jgi:chemotaxis-related protein WspB
MLVLTFRAGREPVGLDIRRVREVIPRVRLTPLTGGPDWLAGVFVYRGRVIPVADLHKLGGAGDCPPHLSSRIVLVPVGGDDQLVGLLASQVADLRELPDGATSSAIGGDANFGPVVADGGGVMRLLDPERLFSPAAWKQVLAAAGVPA